jgi:hypothetical protein
MYVAGGEEKGVGEEQFSGCQGSPNTRCKLKDIDIDRDDRSIVADIGRQNIELSGSPKVRW